jgi:hypothetical protein
MIIKFNPFYKYVFLLFGIAPHNEGKIQNEDYKQVRLIAIQDFSKTKLFKVDSVFYVSLYDTLHRVALKKIGKGNYKSVIGQAYPKIIAVETGSTPFKFFLDTTIKMDVQNKKIPSRFFEKDGRVFLWSDKYYPLTDSAVKVLDKFHLIVRKRKNDLDKLWDFETDDSKQGTDYYFCRSNLSVYKRVITNVAIGYYNPPHITCK